MEHKELLTCFRQLRMRNFGYMAISRHTEKEKLKKGGQPSENHWLPALAYRRRSVFFFYMFIPPQQWITWPVTYDERSLARNVATLATSSGVPPRRKGICAAHCLRVSSERALVMSVMMNPGAMQLARTPREPSSLAMLFARPIMPAFDAE